jgi:hypothetical protein
MNHEEMTMHDLAVYLPNIMPEGQMVREGDAVLVRLMKQSAMIHRATILKVFESVTGEDTESTVLNRPEAKELCIKVEFEGQEGSEYPVWPFQDSIYTYDWVNDWAGATVVEAPNQPAPKNPDEDSGKVRRLAKRFKNIIER